MYTYTLTYHILSHRSIHFHNFNVFKMLISIVVRSFQRSRLNFDDVNLVGENEKTSMRLYLQNLIEKIQMY